jgi:hypothetical protein
MGYGTKSLDLLQKYFEGKIVDMSNEDTVKQPFLESLIEKDPNVKLLPLLRRLQEV